MQNFADEISGKAVIMKAVGNNTKMNSMEPGREKGIWNELAQACVKCRILSLVLNL
jgi:hypothetical protein